MLKSMPSTLIHLLDAGRIGEMKMQQATIFWCHDIAIHTDQEAGISKYRRIPGKKVRNIISISQKKSTPHRTGPGNKKAIYTHMINGKDEQVTKSRTCK